MSDMSVLMIAFASVLLGCARRSFTLKDGSGQHTVSKPGRRRDSHHCVKSSTADTNSLSQGLSAVRAVNARESAEAAARQ